MIRSVGIFIVGGVLCYLLSEMGSRLSKPIGVICAVGALISAVSGFSEIGGEMRRLIDESGLGDAGLDVMKILGTGYVFGICSDTLEGLSESGIARAVDTVCKVEIMLITLPYIKETVAFGISLIK